MRKVSKYPRERERKGVGENASRGPRHSLERGLVLVVCETALGNLRSGTSVLLTKPQDQSIPFSYVRFELNCPDMPEGGFETNHPTWMDNQRAKNTSDI